MNNYKGMRWFKCDLHMHTPVDITHWVGEQMRNGKEAEMASRFAEACFDSGLDVIGITDHNFLSKNFLAQLYNAFSEIERKYKHKVTVFPGFEFEAAGVGRGVHVLCLFEPNTDADTVDSILTECGIKHPRKNLEGVLEKSDLNLKDILRIVQDTHSGLVILPHTLSQDGIFDNNSISEWLQKDQFKNPDLLAVEVPRPINKMSPAFQKLFSNGRDCLPEWKRIRSIAPIMSSDCKRLIGLDDKNQPLCNSIGFRYSWIKMSTPSVEALRQAFLDHASRIILPDDVCKDIHPNRRVKHSYIQSIAIKNAIFLADQDIHFSNGLNCIIGGRGSGKSTLLEYLRIMFQKDQDTGIDYSTKERIKRIRETLRPENLELKISWRSSEDIEDVIELIDGRAVVAGRDLPDPDTYFDNLPIAFYSQQQLSKLTDLESINGEARQPQRILILVDGFAKDDLVFLSNKESELTAKIHDVFSVCRKVNLLETSLRKARQEYQELDRQWKARNEIQEDARIYQLLKRESSYLELLHGKQAIDVVKLAECVVQSHVAFDEITSPHFDWIKELDDKVLSAKKDLLSRIASEVEKYQKLVEELKTKDPLWESIAADLNQAESVFFQACRAKGLEPEDVHQLHELSQQRSNKQQEIDKILQDLEYAKPYSSSLDTLLGQLHEVWRNQYQKRLDAANRANELAVLEEGNHNFIEVSVSYQQDLAAFNKLWQQLAPVDGRTRLGRTWDGIGQELFSRFVESGSMNSPWQLLYESVFSNTQAFFSETVDAVDLKRHLSENYEAWEKLRCSRVPDAVDMTLYRADGTVAGSIAKGSLSDGQRNTAALALLLAQEGGPLIIDQPEDELDSNFVFRELIPMLRKVKSKRQLILATHNANLPVNGDAELVYAFEARDGRGEVLAQGGLDQKAVTKAVLDIMEGTEEAFRRRLEKYSF